MGGRAAVPARVRSRELLNIDIGMVQLLVALIAGVLKFRVDLLSTRYKEAGTFHEGIDCGD